MGAAARRAPWRSRDVWAISLSACFADTGYQAVLAGFPLFLVITLHQPVWEFGLASAISYGGGALFSQAGGRIGDRIGHRRLALIGNTAIPLLSLCALVASPAWAIGLLAGGWWARNLRSPSRRVMLVDAVPDERQRSAAFGFLHALDVGGGAVAGIYLLVAVAAHVPFRWIFLGTAIPLALSTFSLAQARVGGRRPTPVQVPPSEGASETDARPEGARGTETTDTSGAPAERAPRTGASAAVRQEPAETTESSAPDEDMVEAPVPPGARALLVAAALYGFTFFSVGFPVLTVAQGSGRLVAGIGAFLVLQVASSATGFLLGGRLGTEPVTQFARLGLLGYLGAAAGTAMLALGSAEHGGLAVLMVGVAVIGFGLGIVETLEPTAMSVLRPGAQAGRAMGALSAARSAGTFVANLAMGLIYSVSVSLAYGYAAALAAAAGLVVLASLPALRSWQQGRGGGG